MALTHKELQIRCVYVGDMYVIITAARLLDLFLIRLFSVVCAAQHCISQQSRATSENAKNVKVQLPSRYVNVHVNVV